VLPCFVVHRKPVTGDLAINVPIAHSGLFKSDSYGFAAPVGDKILDGLLYEFAALSGPGDPVNTLNGGFRQDNVDAFVHGNAS